MREDGLVLQLRDVVLAVLIEQTGQKLADYGFKKNKNGQRKQRMLQLTALYFASDADRRHAFEKWHAWVKENVKDDAAPKQG